MSAPLLETRALNVAVNRRTLCRDLDWQVAAGEFWAVLGKNGAGKTTLLTTLAGLSPPASGVIDIAGRAANQTPLRELARQRGFLPQGPFDPFASSALEAVLAGRHPHLGRWDWESAQDHAIAESALAEVGLAGIGQRDVQTLSGGERQRLALAVLLAQAPQLFLLDEPLAHLDINHQVMQLRLLARHAQAGKGVVAVLHDPGLAVRHCTCALLLFGDGGWLAGPAAEVISAENLSRLYGQKMTRLMAGDHPVFVLD